MLDIKNVSYSYDDISVLSKVSMSIPNGTLCHIEAGNGHGKTTLLSILCGLKKPETGVIFFQNESIHSNLTAYHEKIIFLGHDLPLHEVLTIQENWFLDYHDTDIYEQAVRWFDLQNHDHVPVRLLSSGQRKKASLLRLFFKSATIWILDEPLVGLDKVSIDKLLAMIEAHVNQQGIVILTSHQTIPELNCPTMRHVL